MRQSRSAISSRRSAPRFCWNRRCRRGTVFGRGVLSFLTFPLVKKATQIQLRTTRQRFTLLLHFRVVLKLV